MPAVVHERDNIIVGAAMRDRAVSMPAPRAAKVAARLRGTAFSAAYAHQHHQYKYANTLMLTF